MLKKVLKTGPSRSMEKSPGDPRGFFHRENRILLRKSQIFDLNTILYSQSYVKKKFKKPDLLGLWKNPLTIPCLLLRGRESEIVQNLRSNAKETDQAKTWVDSTLAWQVGYDLLFAKHH